MAKYCSIRIVIWNSFAQNIKPQKTVTHSKVMQSNFLYWAHSGLFWYIKCIAFPDKFCLILWFNININESSLKLIWSTVNYSSKNHYFLLSISLNASKDWQACKLIVYDGFCVESYFNMRLAIFIPVRSSKQKKLIAYSWYLLRAQQQLHSCLNVCLN